METNKLKQELAKLAEMVTLNPENESLKMYCEGFWKAMKTLYSEEELMKIVFDMSAKKVA